MNEEQESAFCSVKGRKNVLITGSAGVGKSFTIKHIVDWAKKTGKKIGVTSSTGTSAITINGRTIHSFLGIGLAKKGAYDLYIHTRQKFPTTITKLKELDILIIDEISMISDVLFDKVSEYLQIIRKNTQPFGNIQIILCGDMCQLPPVDGDFCFISKTWADLDIKKVELIKQIRQDGDIKFQKILNEVRFGVCSDDTLNTLKSLTTPNFGEIKPTILYSKNVNVDSINSKEYETLKKSGAKERRYDSVFSENKYTRTWAESLKIPEFIDLCIGTQVMLTANLAVEEGFANGSRGMVVDFTDEGPVVLFKNGDQLIIEPWLFKDDNDDDIWCNSVPLRLAYAITIHKSQSMTLDAAIVDLGPSIFEYGQAYVALSRVRDMKSVKIINVLKSSFQTHEDVLKFYNQ